MAWNETLLERPLRRPFDQQTREAIEAEYERRKHEMPVATQFRWHHTEPKFILDSKWLSLTGHFTPERFIVNAKLSLAAKLMVTDEHRRRARQIISEIADSLEI
jgi:hypothetical protein